jgi:hypothetical protein
MNVVFKIKFDGYNEKNLAKHIYDLPSIHNVKYNSNSYPKTLRSFLPRTSFPST